MLNHHKAIISLAFFTLLSSALMLYRPLFLGEAYLPARLLPHIEPWKSANVNAPKIPWNPLLWDGIAQFYPWRDFMWRSEREGTIPLVNPHQFSGAPFLANSQSAPLYPIHLLLAPFNTVTGMTLALLIHLWLAGFGMAMLLRRWGCGISSALTSAWTYQLSTFFVCWLQLSSVPTTVCWYPWLLLTAWNLMEQPNHKQTAQMALAVGMMLLAGHLQFAFYGMMLMVLFISAVIISRWRTQRRVSWIKPSGAIILGVMLAMPQLLPTLTLAANGHRKGSATSEGYYAYTQTSLQSSNWVGYFLPDFFGHPLNGTYWGQTNYAENALSVGIPALILAIIAMLFRRSRLTLFFTSFLILTWLMASGSYIDKLFYFGIPGFSGSGSPARVLILSAFSVAILAGLGLEKIRFIVKRKNIIYALFIPIIMFGITAGIAVKGAEESIQKFPEIKEIMFKGAPILFSGFAASILALFCFYYRDRRYAKYAPPLFAGFTLLFLLAQNVGYNPTCERSEVYPRTNVTDRLKALEKGGSIAVYNDKWSLDSPPNAALPPNSATVYDLKDIAGYDSLIWAEEKNTLDKLNGQDSAPQENGNMLFCKTLDAEKLKKFNVKYLYSPNVVPIGKWKDLGDGIYQNNNPIYSKKNQFSSNTQNSFREGLFIGLAGLSCLVGMFFKLRNT